jgi:hypothetical protein
VSNTNHIEYKDVETSETFEKETLRGVSAALLRIFMALDAIEENTA